MTVDKYLKLVEFLKTKFPTAWQWYVADDAEIYDKPTPKAELDNMITALIHKISDFDDEDFWPF